MTAMQRATATMSTDLRIWIAAAAVAVFLAVGRRSPLGDLLILQPRFWAAAVIAGISIAVVVELPPHHRLLAKVSALLLLWLAGSALWAPDATLAVVKLTDILILAIVAASAYRLALVYGSSFVLRSVLVTGGLLVLLGIAGLVALIGSGGGPARLSVFGGGPNVYGRNLAVVAAAALAAIPISRSRLMRTGLIVLFLVATGLVVASGSRGALVGLAGGLVVVAALLVGRRVRVLSLRFPIAVGGFVLLLAGLVVVGTFLLPGSTAEEVAQRRIVELTIEDRYDTYRTEFAGRAVECFVEFPFSGAGLAGYEARGLGVYPHNVMAEILCEQGAVGFSLAIATAAIFVMTVIAVRHRTLGVLLIGVIATWAVASQFSGDLYDARGVFVVGAVAVGLGAARVLPPPLSPVGVATAPGGHSSLDEA